MQLSAVLIVLSTALIGNAAAAGTAKFSAFSSKACSGAALGIKSVSKTEKGVNCFTLDKVAHSFEADTDGCTFAGFTKADCGGSEIALEQGSCDAGTGKFKSVQQGC